MKNLEIVTKIKVYDIASAPEPQKSLIKAAQEATQTSYAPYSEYNVGAAALLKSGEIISGSNQENAAYPSGTCAERTALFYANAKYPETPVVMVAVAAFNKGDFTPDICTPCGSCRQVFVEVENRFNQPVTILMCSKNEVYEVESIRDLLPLCFTKESME